ncbi:DUF5676 family membrane protein [Citromicrobium bathyomarinum]
MGTTTTAHAIKQWGWTLGVLLLVSYLLCVVFGRLAPADMRMYEAWAPLLPGFEWLTWQGFLAGAVGSFAYGWYLAVLGVALYRFFGRRGA